MEKEEKLMYLEDLCPNCNGRISDIRIKKALPCENCWPFDFSPLDLMNKDQKTREKAKKYLKNMAFLLDFEEEIEKFKKYFEKLIGNKAWNLQITWAKRIFLGESFAIIAPTGVGKTTFGLVSASYLVKNRGWKVYIILPTTLLAKQVKDRLESLDSKLKILAYHSDLKKKEKEEFKERLKNNDFEVLITTTNFLYRNFELLKDKKFHYIFVDDVDSLLKSAKNIDYVLKLMGFDDEAINVALENIKLKIRLLNAKKQEIEEISKKIEENNRILEEKKKKINSILVASSATAKPRGLRIKLLRELLNFEVGRAQTNLRNITDSYTKKFDLNYLLKIIKRLKDGILLFVSQDFGKEKVYELKEFLNKNNISALTYEELNEKNLDKFIKKEVKVLIGIASYINPLARGIDLPEAIKYAVFFGVPKFIFNANLERNPRILLNVLLNLNKVLPEEIKEKSEFSEKLMPYLTFLRRIINYNKEYIEQNEYYLQKLKEIQEFLISLISKREIKDLLIKNPDISFDGENFVIADVAAYLQASGRTSRLYVKGLSKGLSILIVDNEKAFNNLIKRIKWFFDDLEFKEFEKLDLEKIKKEINEERELIKKIKRGEIKEEIKQLVKTTLIIVESPNKARTIANFFGDPTRRIIRGLNVYEVSLGNEIILITSSQGHILDLIKKKGYFGVFKEEEKFYPSYTTIKRCLFNNEIKQITDDSEFCELMQLDKREFIEAIQKLALEVDEILLATDPDTEGEKISYDLYCLIKPYNKNVKRIEYHEVTKKAILEAIKNKREINIQLIKGQILRRLADRWVGFALSLKLQRDFNDKNYSAGRVQTPILGWVIKRDEESKEKKVLIITELLRKLDEELNKLKEEGVFLSNTLFIEEEKKEELKKIKEVNKIVFEILEKREETQKPLPPYTTDALLKDANEKLRFSAQKTMQLAQNLFELGLITYHRTDSTHISNKGIEIAKEYLKEKNLIDYFTPRKWGEEGAHEAIRPTKAYDTEELRMLVNSGIIPVRLSSDHYKLYDLIFKRFVASQMKEIKIEFLKTNMKFLKEEETIYEKEVELPNKVLENGFNLINPVKVYFLEENEYNAKVEKKLIPKIPHYNQGSLVEEMKKRKLGRPSTYATIIQTLLRRAYIIEINDQFLVHTKKGKIVFDYLIKNYNDLVSEEFTRYLEEKMIEIEKEKADHQVYLKKLFDKLDQYRLWESLEWQKEFFTEDLEYLNKEENEEFE